MRHEEGSSTRGTTVESADDRVDEETVELDVEATEDLDDVIANAVAAVEETEREAGAARSVERLERELAELRDRSVRTLADFDNFRKRADRERIETKRYALLEPMRELLEVLDNLERAVEAGGAADDLRQGVDMIVRQLGDMLRRHGVEAIEAEGRPFDPNLHEAVSREDSAEVAEPTVARELQKGYVLHDRLLRPARVAVAVPREDSAGAKAPENVN